MYPTVAPERRTDSPIDSPHRRRAPTFGVVKKRNAMFKRRRFDQRVARFRVYMGNLTQG
jgi:hypothetical protein